MQWLWNTICSCVLRIFCQELYPKLFLGNVHLVHFSNGFLMLLRSPNLTNQGHFPGFYLFLKSRILFKCSSLPMLSIAANHRPVVTLLSIWFKSFDSSSFLGLFLLSCFQTHPVSSRKWGLPLVSWQDLIVLMWWHALFLLLSSRNSMTCSLNFFLPEMPHFLMNCTNILALILHRSFSLKSILL